MIGTGAAVFGCQGLVLSAAEARFFREADPLGFILFARNVDNPDQLRRLTADLRASVGRQAMIMVDQEGGRVQRLRAPHWREFPPPLETVGKAGADAAKAMAIVATLIACDLRAVGIDANCAPVGDIASAQTHPFLRNRCYGSRAESVIPIARAVADAYLAAGILPVIKHMPGHGRSQNDTHHDLPTVTATRETLSNTDFAPFRALADLPMAMTAHIVFAAYDASNPATQSPAVIRAIREEIGFQGLLITDDLNMQALSGSLAERAAASLKAGCDIALHCKGDLAEMQAVAAAAGTMNIATKSRAQSALARRRSTGPVGGPFDVPALEAELRRLLGGNAYV